LIKLDRNFCLFLGLKRLIKNIKNSNTKITLFAGLLLAINPNAYSTQDKIEGENSIYSLKFHQTPDQNSNNPAESYKLLIDTSSFLSESQTATFSEGFSIFSTISLTVPNNTLPKVFERKCVFKFDSWNEQFKITMVEDQYAFFAREKETLYEKCFHIEIENETLTTLSGEAVLSISIDPISYETAEDMKNWIKNAQPGPLKPVIKFLFSDNSMVYQIDKSFEISELYDKYTSLIKRRADSSLKSSENKTINSSSLNLAPTPKRDRKAKL
jgi:hypothetical protein